MINTNKKVNMITVITVGIILFGLFIANVVTPNPEVLSSERRKASELPELTAASILNGKFMAGFDDWASDSFVLRDGFRTIRTAAVLGAFMQTDKSGIYLDKNVGAGAFKVLDESDLQLTADKLQAYIENLSSSYGGLNIYFSIIPSKTDCAARDYPGTDYETVRALFEKTVTGASHIDISERIGFNVFYKTDLHWAQPGLTYTTMLLGEAMDFEACTDYYSVRMGPFKGAYYGQLALPIARDEMVYLTNKDINDSRVMYLDATTAEFVQGEVYDLEAFRGRDPYDIFLGGAQPLITIENPNAENDRELFLFRDSFGSSIAPLLVSSYSKITLIDLRYIDARMLDQFVEFTEGGDVLFLYSTEILGTPEIFLTGTN